MREHSAAQIFPLLIFCLPVRAYGVLPSMAKMTTTEITLSVRLPNEYIYLSISLIFHTEAHIIAANDYSLTILTSMLASGEGRLSLCCGSVIRSGNDDNCSVNGLTGFEVRLRRRCRSSYVNDCSRALESSSWSSIIPGLLL